MTAEFPLAVHALVYLMHTDRITSSQELADNICTNPARVRKVMSKLEQANLVKATRGKGSGYLFHSTEELTLLQVLQALEETPLSMNWRSGDMDKACLIASGMGTIMDDLYGQLNEACNQKLRSVTIASINRQIFNHSAVTEVSPDLFAL